MRERLGDHLPKLSEKDRENLRNSIDFVGLNHYTTRFISHVETPREIHFYQVQEMERNGTYQDWNSHLEFFFLEVLWIFLVYVTFTLGLEGGLA